MIYCIVGLALVALVGIGVWRWLIGAVEGGKSALIGRKPRKGQFWKEGSSWVWREPPE